MHLRSCFLAIIVIMAQINSYKNSWQVWAFFTLSASSSHGSSPASFCRIRPNSSQAGSWHCPVLASNWAISFSSIQLCEHATCLPWSLGQVHCLQNSLDAKGKMKYADCQPIVLIVSEVLTGPAANHSRWRVIWKCGSLDPVLFKYLNRG